MTIAKDFFKKLSDNHPFITILSFAGQDYVGIVQNRDDQCTSIYDYGSIIDTKTKELFLELGEVWWWESNRQIPINIFLLKEIAPFRYAIRNFSTKDTKILLGPCTSLNDIIVKRIKRRSITLVRKLG